MKSLKFLKEELLSKANNSKVLSNEEQKQINGGYSSKEECTARCGGAQGINGWKTPSGTCYVDFVIGNVEYWDCRES